MEYDFLEGYLLDLGEDDKYFHIYNNNRNYVFNFWEGECGFKVSAKFWQIIKCNFYNILPKQISAENPVLWGFSHQFDKNLESNISGSLGQGKN